MGLQIKFQRKSTHAIVERFYENVHTLEQLRQRYSFIHAGLQFDKDYDVLAVVENAAEKH